MRVNRASSKSKLLAYIRELRAENKGLRKQVKALKGKQ
jgi:hypothetical protein